jgi:hypothetical protein
VQYPAIHWDGSYDLEHAPLWAQILNNDMQAGKIRRVQINSEKRKEKNRITHSAPGTIKVKAARKKKIVAEVE